MDMTKLLTALCLLLSACAPIESEDQSGRAEIELALEAWNGAGLPDVSHCAVQRWARVDTDTFNSICGDSCVTAHGACTVACTEPNEPGVAYFDGALIANDPATESVARAHEQLHSWSACAFGDADTAHARADVWQVMQTIDRDLRKLPH